jgi:hypothetical protein
LNIDESGESENEKEVLDSNDSVNKAVNDAHGVNVGEDNDNENPCANMKGNCGEDQDDVVDWDNTELKGNGGEDQDDVVDWDNTELKGNGDEDQDDVVDWNETDQKGNSGKDQDDIVDWDEKELHYAKVASADPLHVVDGAWQNETQDQQTNIAGHFAEKQKESSNIINKYCTTTKISNKFDSDAGVLDIFGGNFKAELNTNTGLAMKSDALDVYVSGPFRNAETKKSHYVVVYGSLEKPGL